MKALTGGLAMRCGLVVRAFAAIAIASVCLSGKAAAQAPERPIEVEPAPSLFWVVAGITLGAGGLVLNIDSARRFDDGDPTCFHALDPGGCLIEAYGASASGWLGGLSLVLYGLWLGEHEASAALASGRPLANHDSLETWSLVGVLGGFAVAVSINIFAIARLYTSIDFDDCKDAARGDRAEACAGGDLLPLAIVQSAAFGIAMASAAPLGYAVGYDSTRREHAGGARALVLPWAGHDAFGLSLTVLH